MVITVSPASTSCDSDRVERPSRRYSAMRDFSITPVIRHRFDGPIGPIAEALAAWAEQTLRQLSRKSELAQAFRYMRARWTALVRCFEDGRLALDNFSTA